MSTETTIPTPSSVKAEEGKGTKVKKAAAPKKSAGNKLAEKASEGSAATDVRDSRKKIEAMVEAKKAKKEEKKAAKNEVIDKRIPVVATAKCWYRNTRWKKGDKFTIKREEHFSSDCMELL